jgi:response regulator of citrate/malate metabolism
MTLEKALIVDDSKAWQLLSKLDLEEYCNCNKVDIASSFTEAKKIIRKDNLYDLYLVDSLRTKKKREGEWKQVVEHIRGVHKDARITIYTSYLDDKIRKEAKQTNLEIFEKASEALKEYLQGLA